MKHEKLAEALDQISEKHVAEAANARKRHRPYWLGAVAAVLAILILVFSVDAPIVQAQAPLAAPQYPDMAPYPDESAFVDPATGEFDGDGFSAIFDAWRTDQLAQRNQPKGYADSLKAFFGRSTREFLSGAGAENRVCSPLNVYMALAMLAEITGGESRQQILNLLNAGDLDSLRTQAGQVWNAHYCADGASASLLANSLWLDAELDYDPDAVKTLADSYYASVYQGELGSAETDKALQDWLNEQTGGLLKDQVKDIGLDAQTVLALVSTIYFRAKWRTEFNAANNTKDIFYAPSGSRPVTYMNQTLLYGPYYWGEDFGAVCLNLENGGSTWDSSSMWLILPDEGLTPEDILASGNALSMILNADSREENSKSVKVNLSLPKFDVYADMKLNESLQALGVTDVFTGRADFSPILPDVDCWLNSVEHAARVKIDEEGVEAAAYTVMMVAGASMPPVEEIDFVLNRPFLFLITSSDNLPLFAGVVNQPFSTQ